MEKAVEKIRDSMHPREKGITPEAILRDKIEKIVKAVLGPNRFCAFPATVLVDSKESGTGPKMQIDTTDGRLKIPKIVPQVFASLHQRLLQEFPDAEFFSDTPDTEQK